LKGKKNEALVESIKNKFIEIPERLTEEEQIENLLQKTQDEITIEQDHRKNTDDDELLLRLNTLQPSHLSEREQVNHLLERMEKKMELEEEVKHEKKKKMRRIVIDVSDSSSSESEDDVLF